LERPLLRGLYVDECPAAAVECPSRKAKGRRASSERVSQPPDNKDFLEKVSENMPKRTLPRTAAVDPLLGLVEDRFRLLKQCSACDDRNDEGVFDRRLDEVQRRIRRLDERIVRVATSAPGLLAQLRLLAAFYEESANGSGRRGSLLIQVIADGVYAALREVIAATNHLD
jgi:hypothetical protein